MINYAIYTELNTMLSGVSGLTAQLSEGAGSFTLACVKYLESLQIFTDTHRLYIATDVALALQKILVYSGEAKERNITTPIKRNLRKEQDAYSVRCLDNLRLEVKEFLQKERKTYEDCADIWRQVVARLINKFPEAAHFDRGQAVEQIVAVIKQDGELLPYYAHVTGLVGVYNAKALLETVLPQLELY